MKTLVRTVLCVGGAIALSALGWSTIFGSTPKLIGVPLFIVAGIIYGLEFEMAFWITTIIALGAIFLWVMIRLYPDYYTLPIAMLFVVVVVAVVAAVAKAVAYKIRTLFRQRNAQREREEREAAVRRLVEEKNIKSRPGEPLPPWILFPGHTFFNGLQRFGFTGPGDEYMDNEWGSFWTGLTINQRHEYFQRYDLGDQWPERDDWHFLWVTWEKMEEPCIYLEKLVQEATPQAHPGEPAPPWIQNPRLDDATSDWNRGEGADYLEKTFLPFFKALAEGEKEDFLRRHDLGPGWEDRDEWLWLIQWEGDAGKLQ